LVSADVIFESVLYFSTQVPVTISETVPPSLSVSLPTLASNVSSPVSPAETKVPPASKPARNFRYVYTHRPKVPASEPIPTNLFSVDGPPPPSASPSDFDILIALRKGKQSCTDYSISNFVSYDHLNLIFRQFALSLSFESILTLYTETLLVPTWKQVMNEEMEALTSRGT